VRLLYSMQHGLAPFSHHLGKRFSKAEFVRVVRLAGVHHRATQFDAALDEVWLLLDARNTGVVEWHYAANILKLAEMDKKWLVNKYPYDRDDQLPSYYGICV